MTQYLMLDNNKTYEAIDDAAFLELVKNGNSHTKHLSLNAYIEQVAQTINSLSNEKIAVRNASEIVKRWRRMGIIHISTDDEP